MHGRETAILLDQISKLIMDKQFYATYCTESVLPNYNVTQRFLYKHGKLSEFTRSTRKLPAL